MQYSLKFNALVLKVPLLCNDHYSIYDSVAVHCMTCAVTALLTDQRPDLLKKYAMI